jgi:hypothetical protein
LCPLNILQLRDFCKIFCFSGLLFWTELLSKIGPTLKNLLNFKTLKEAIQHKVGREEGNSRVRFEENVKRMGRDIKRRRVRRKEKVGEKGIF